MELAVDDMKIEKYSSYKDSGTNWLGEVPSHWELTRLATRFAERRTKVSDKDFEALSVTKNGILPQLEDAAKTNDGDNRKLVRKGDFVINSRSDRKGSSGISPLDGSVSLINIVLEPKDIDSTFCNYLLKGNNFIEEFYRNGHGIVADLWTTRYDEMKLIKIAIPPKEEQTAIAQFLDRKTAQIDKAIAQKEKLIELLKERRQILIHKAVTKGLNWDLPDEGINGLTDNANPKIPKSKKSKFRHSGVEWIGEIPEHWEVKKIIGLCRIVRGNSSFSKDELLNKGEYVALQYGKTYKVDEIDEQYQFYVNNEFYKDSQIVNFGDVIIISTSETIEDLGHSVFYKRNDLGLLGGEQVLLKPKVGIVDPNYLHFSTKVFSKELRKYSTGIKVFRFNINDLKTIYTPVPPIPEQNEIVAYIKTQTSIMEKVKTFQEQQIEKLKEYKATLINSAVTGKIKVC